MLEQDLTLAAAATYPIFAATFANNRPGYLAVGGGGGAGRSGVKVPRMGPSRHLGKTEI